MDKPPASVPQSHWGMEPPLSAEVIVWMGHSDWLPPVPISPSCFPLLIK